MTTDDIEHLAQVCESVFAQINASGSMKAEDFDGFVGRMLWAIHASGSLPESFDEGKFRARCRGETV
jgi:hypothetical protein